MEIPNMKKLALCIGACALALLATSCSDKMDPNDPSSVRKYLVKQKIAFTPNQFNSYAANGDTANMSLFLLAKFDINEADDKGNCAVAIAVNKGKFDVLQYLAAHDARLNVTNSNGESVLDDAVAQGYTDIVKFLVQKIQEEGAVNDLGASVALAAKVGNTDGLRILGDAGAPLEIRGADGYFPIHLAAKGGHYDAVEYLISKGVDVNVKCSQGYSVLDWAKNEGYTRIISLLQKHGAKYTPAYLKMKH